LHMLNMTHLSPAAGAMAPPSRQTVLTCGWTAQKIFEGGRPVRAHKTSRHEIRGAEK
jgi:hypothetical protein